MQVSMQALSKLLEATDSTIVRWIKKRGLPAQEVGGQYRVNRTELLEWATANGVRLALDLFDHLEANAAVVPTLNEALQAGGIHYGLQGSTREEALRALVQILPLPEGIDPELLLSIFLRGSFPHRPESVTASPYRMSATPSSCMCPSRR